MTDYHHNLRRTINRHWLMTIGLLILVGIAGCKSVEKLGRVSGKVTFQGSPVAEGMVLFSCIDKGVNMTATLQSDGSYEIIMAKGAGLPLGTYRVCVNPPPTFYPIGQAAPKQTKQYPSIPMKYRKYETSGLTINVKDGDNRLDIEMAP
jgi:hypothetical protein